MGPAALSRDLDGRKIVMIAGKREGAKRRRSRQLVIPFQTPWGRNRKPTLFSEATQAFI
jgi:hypothetical protein